jgi:hypothetical protein
MEYKNGTGGRFDEADRGLRRSMADPELAPDDRGRWTGHHVLVVVRVEGG